MGEEGKLMEGFSREVMMGLAAVGLRETIACTEAQTWVQVYPLE